MVTMLKNKCSVWKSMKFPTFWYNCYYFTWSDTYFIQLETLLINHPSYVKGYKKVFAGLFFVGSHSIRTAVRSLFRKFAELLNETRYGPDFINHQPF